MPKRVSPRYGTTVSATVSVDELTKVEYAVVEADVLSGDAVEIIWMILKTEVFYGGVKGDYKIQRIGGIL